MHDLAALHRLDDLRAAGVTGVKIEGRLKNAAWVRRAVGLYRQALEGHDVGQVSNLSQENQDRLETCPATVSELGAYTGRAMTCGYLDGRRGDLTGQGGREAATAPIPGQPGADLDRLAETGQAPRNAPFSRGKPWPVRSQSPFPRRSPRSATA